MEKLKQAIVPSLGGIVVGMILMTFVFGFVSGSTAANMVNDAVEDATVSALVPFCVEKAKADEVVLAEVMAKSSYQRRSEVSKAGWATYPADASSGLKRAIDEGCIKALS